MATKAHAHPMTTGKPLPVILRFSVPIFFSQLLQQFYNTADTMIVGRFLGVDALAAVGSTWALNYLIVYLCTGICYGGRYPKLLPKGKECRFHLSTLGYVARMGVPMGLQYSITAIGAVTLQSSVNGLGSLAVAGFSAAYKIKGLFLCPIQAIGTALATYAGQNFGAGKYDRIHMGVRHTLFVGLGYSAVVLVVFLLACEPLAMLFVDSSETGVISYSARLLRWLSFCYFELAILLPVRYAVQGMGKSVLSLCSGMAEMAARVIFALFFIPVYGYLAVCISESGTFLLGVLVIVPIYLYLIRNAKK